jgi:uncharacterized protein (DUF433 family)/DNA-binding transcriptional MerR regulator
MQPYTYIGQGLYSMGEARRLTGIPGRTLNRWVKGYARHRDGERVEYEALISPSLPILDDQITLSFRDLVELRFINRLREHHVSWAEIKTTIEAARELLDTAYPFGTHRFATDGRALFSEIIDRPGFLLRLRTRQISFDRIFSPDLYDEIEFENDTAVRWRPDAGKSFVIIDPGRSFGKPILDEFGIATGVIAKAVAIEESVRRVADWFELPEDAVTAAVDFEQKLAA